MRRRLTVPATLTLALVAVGACGRGDMARSTENTASSLPAESPTTAPESLTGDELTGACVSIDLTWLTLRFSGDLDQAQLSGAISGLRDSGHPDATAIADRLATSNAAGQESSLYDAIEWCQDQGYEFEAEG